MNQDSLIHRPNYHILKSRQNTSRQMGVGQIEVSKQVHLVSHQLSPVSSPDPPHHAPSENFLTGHGAEGLGTRLNCPLSLHPVCNESWVQNGASSSTA